MSGPANAITDADTGARWYIHPRTGERFMSVTTVLGYIAKFGLPNWAARLAATAAVDRIEWLTRCAEVDACNGKGDDACGVCRGCAIAWLSNRHNEVRDEAGDLGTKLHEAGEQHALFGPGATVDADVQPLVDGYLRWVEQWKPRFITTEATVISRKWGYAGTLDWIAEFDADNLPPKFKHLSGVPVIGDTKSVKTLDVAKGWQVVGYSKADAVLLPDGSEQPLPPVGGGLILHVRPEKVQVREVHITDANHSFFIHTLRMTEGLNAGLNTVLSRPFTLKEN